MPWETQKEPVTGSGVRAGKKMLARWGWAFQAEGVACHMQRPVGPRCSPEVGKSKMLTMEERSERRERQGPDSQAL